MRYLSTNLLNLASHLEIRLHPPTNSAEEPYFFLSLMDPQAFNGLSDLSSHEVKHLNAAYMDLLYYSYVTLSTLGYGDVTPVGRAAQSLAYLEAICGVMYVAVLVAALVGSYGKSASPRLDTLAPSRRQPSSCSKPTSKWEPSQKGLFFEPPQRHRVKCSWELPSPNSVFSSLMPPVTT